MVPDETPSLTPSEELSERVLGRPVWDSLLAVHGSGFGPAPESYAVMARWWQLEAYLRLLVYIQLQATLGSRWEAEIGLTAQKRSTRSQAVAYMTSADDEFLLAHADISVLLDLVESYWDQCSPGIGMTRPVWQGKVEEVIKPIRHRLAHCRRPHADDRPRLGQLLRDLEPGANSMLRAYTDWWPVDPSLPDPLVRSWVHGEHPAAQRLLEHGRRNYDISFNLGTSTLPWARPEGQITGTPGAFWVMIVHSGLGQIGIHDFIEDSGVRASLPWIGHIVQSSPWSIVVTLPAVNDPNEVADSVGRCFDAVFLCSRRGRRLTHVDNQWTPVAGLDPRIDAFGLLGVLSSLNADDPLQIFSAQSER